MDNRSLMQSQLGHTLTVYRKHMTGSRGEEEGETTHRVAYAAAAASEA